MKRGLAFALAMAVLLFAAACNSRPVLQDSVPEDVGTAVSVEILRENSGGYKKGEFQTESHEILGVEQKEGTLTVYAYVLYLEYDFDEEHDFRPVSGSHMPVALSFQKDGDSWVLTEYWIPKDGAGYAASIREKFPGGLADRALNPGGGLETRQRDCDRKAKEYVDAKYST